ncbi:uncharacterized protein ACLA_007920 [Aspergillus clavatus NRRL 1]|uniref:Ubiquinol-cytochrome-c reductase cytochrome c1 n=1 Tax=Aspergillus clavatus (strain ATCC 1007 / CBS 513.65 / DSM 816 / NCTC 3887 / NRRL 1 / QM 1276 / 107) TaxID=344612 RepID=A1CDV5_ASPCL|nr:uncharacterized protein ACLA_007920 [Aspergillus clavatus NRRL 1]EAW12032.1 hypothetical protein ACLA_007920 [Aspergillus clavatus NRRL 1]
MACPAAEKSQIFLACKAIFTGPHASLRKLKHIQKRITEHQASLGSIIPNFEVNRVSNVAKILLRKGVFQSDTKAKVEFPDLFAPSTAREIQHDASEIEAARSVAEALEEITSVYEREAGENTVIALDAPPPMPDIPAAAVLAVEENSGKLKDVLGRHTNQLLTQAVAGTIVETGLPIPSLYPSYFPYHAQHAILSTVQRILEECCFDFATRWMPTEVHDHGWDCAAAVELTKWTKLLSKWTPRLPSEALDLSASDLDTSMYTIRKIRHTAVHRLPTTARGVGAMVLSAMRFAEVLRDALRAAQLEDLHADIQSKIKTMELNKNALEDHFARELRALQLQREELDRQQERLIAMTIKNDKDNKNLMGLLVEESMERIFNGKGRELDDDDLNGFATADDGEEE